eukprot:2391-Heterococcus_DN1.PRE.2
MLTLLNTGNITLRPWFDTRRAAMNSVTMNIVEWQSARAGNSVVWQQRLTAAVGIMCISEGCCCWQARYSYLVCICALAPLFTLMGAPAAQQHLYSPQSAIDTISSVLGEYCVRLNGSKTMLNPYVQIKATRACIYNAFTKVWEAAANICLLWDMEHDCTFLLHQHIIQKISKHKNSLCADSQSSKRQARSFSVASTRHEQPTQLGSPEIGANSGGQHVFDRAVLTEAVYYQMPALQ